MKNIKVEQTVKTERVYWNQMFKTSAVALLVVSALILCSCGPSAKNSEIVRAMPPPNFDSTELLNIPNEDLMQRTQHIETVHAEGLLQDGLALESSKPLKKCRIKDRFDRKAVFAYQMDEGRLSLDVDGLNMGSTNIERVYLQYKISLQPEFEKKDHCKYASAYQGLIGSAYNELVLREEDTVWEELSDIQAEVGHHITAFMP